MLAKLNYAIPPKIIIKKSVLIGYEVMPPDGLVNRIFNKALSLVNDSLDTQHDSLRELRNVIGFWVKVNADLRLKDCFIIGLETNRWPSEQDHNFVVSKKQVKCVGGAFVCLVGGLIYLLK